MFKLIYQAADDIWKYMWNVGPPPNTKESPTRTRSATV